MAPKPKRPASVWISQVILAIYGFGTALFVVWALYNMLTGAVVRPEYFVFSTIGIVALGALFAAGVWGMAIRRVWGRWLGVGGLTFLLIAAGITQTSRVISDKESGFLSVRFFVAVFIVGGLALLVYKLAAGDASDNFFAGSSAEVTQPVPAESRDQQ
jgi:hypothetical protein